MSPPPKNAVLRLIEGPNRKAILILSFLFVLSACSAPIEDATEESVDQAWTDAAQCLTEHGYSVEQERIGNDWGLSIGGDQDGVLFELRYDRCVGDAEAITLAFLRTQVPEGAERVELASEFQSCLSSAGIPTQVAYDPSSPDAAAVLRDTQTQMGYTAGDPTVADDPRFPAVLGCFDTYEILFPERFEE